MEYNMDEDDVKSLLCLGIFAFAAAVLWFIIYVS
jgi:hypothetical protein